MTSHLASDALPIEMTADGLIGRGAQAIFESIGQAKYVCLGEEHFIQEVPQFAERLYGWLHKEKGFQNAVVENDPYAMQIVMASRARTDSKSILEAFKQYPNLIAFNMPAEMDWLAYVCRNSTSRQPVWGLDQNIGALHILDRLAVLAPDKQSRDAVSRVIDHVRPIDSKRAGPDRPHYMSSPQAELDMAELQRSYTAKPGSEARRILELIEMSAEVYADYRRAVRGIPGAMTNSNLRREGYMKASLTNQMRENGDPKLMFKFGMDHLGRGAGMLSGVFTLGNFISEIAAYKASSSVHIAICGQNEKGQYGGTPWGQMFLKSAPKDHDSVFDLRPLRISIRTGRLKAPADFLRFVDGYDFLVVIAKPTPMPLNR
ncbi:MAG: hypothetical protein JSS72_03650 [Armatimonadetes bacterium]|nr:hypothetical protein [Armatimonadota bacterium]